MSIGPLKVTFKRACMEAEHEFGSLAELAGALQDQSAAFIQMFGADMETVITNLAPADVETEAQRKKREKKEAKEKSDANRQEVAPRAAPAPLPVDTTPNAGGIPAFLDRTVAAAAAPPPPPAPPVAPPAPPSGVLAGKIIPHMEGVAAGAGDGGQQWADWLAASGIVVTGATFSEAMKVIRMQSDEKLKPIADALGIAA